MRLPVEFFWLRWSPLVLLATLISNLLGYALPLLLIQVYDRVIPNAGFETLAVLATGVAVACALDLIIRSARDRLVTRAGLRFESSAHNSALISMFGPSAPSKDDAAPGQTLDRLASIERIRQHYCGEAATALLDIPFIGVFIAFLVAISPWLGLAVTAVAICSVVAMWSLRQGMPVLWAGRQERDQRRHSFLIEALGGIEMLRSQAVEPLFERRYERLIGGSAAMTAELSGRMIYIQGVANTISLISPVAVSGLGSMLVINDQMSIGGLAAAVLLTSRVIQPVLRIEALLAGQQNIRRSEEDLRTLLQHPCSTTGSAPLSKIETVSLHSVMLSPRAASPAALQETSLVLRRGDCVLLTGSDGSGRSTFLSLLAGHLEVSDGEIRVNGCAYLDYDPTALRERICLLSPEFSLLSGTLLENLTAFNPTRNKEYALALVRELGLDIFISRHTEGLGMPVAPHSASALPKSVQDVVMLISCLVSGPDLILFDEANVGLDHQFDRRFLELLRRLSPAAIIVMVSNRPSYQSLANRCLHMQAGTVVEVPLPGVRSSETEAAAS